MFWQQILQLGDALVDSVTSLLFDQAVRQLVGLLETEAAASLLDLHQLILLLTWKKPV